MSISDTSGTLESYKYLGLSTIVEMDHPETNVNLTYLSQTGGTGDAGDKYVGLDRFGRVVDQNWYNTTTSSSTDDFQYGYDRDSNVLWMNNALSSSNSELYGYNGLNELSSFERGTLNSGKTGISGTPAVNEGWGLDAVGNWTSNTVNGSTQTRTANADNQITSISGLTTPGYDGNGNTTTDQAGKTLVYDAWNRLVKYKSGSTVLTAYNYDALGRKVMENPGTVRDIYFSRFWQNIEEDIGGTPQDQYVWGATHNDQLIERDRDADANSVNGLEEKLFALQNSSWDITATVTTSATVVERYQYDPYGLPTVLTASWGSRATSAYAWVYLHQGGRYDTVNLLYDFRNREFSPVLGRWLQLDPYRPLGDSPNLYQDENSNPLSFVDPLGTRSLRLPVSGGTIVVGPYPGPKGGIQISYTGGGIIQIRQWFQIEVVAEYQCPPVGNEQCTDEKHLEVPKEKPSKPNPGVLGHSGHIHQTALPSVPQPVDDNDGGDWQPATTFTTGDDGSIIWHDDPDLVLYVANSALDEAKDLTPPTNSKGQPCKLVGAILKQRFVTQVFINGNPEYTIPWTSSNTAYPYPTFIKPTKPTTTIGDPFIGQKDPVDALKPK
jgi:RHS repeat-associated protein